MPSLLDRFRARTAYIGWLGHNNLGDEAMFHAFSTHVRAAPYPPTSLVGRIECRLLGTGKCFASVCLGGGTRIFGGSWAYLRDAMNAGLPGWTFGTGVKNPDFWNATPNWQMWLSHWQEVLARCSHVSVRGPLSQKILERYGISSTIVGDPVFLLCAEALPALPERPVLGLNVGWTKGRLWGGNDEAVFQAIVGAARVFRDKGWLLRLYCVCPEDLQVCYNAAEQLGVGMNAVERTWNDATSFLQSARGCSVFLGFKLHASALAYCAYVPTIALEYRPKVRDFMACVGAESRCPRTDCVDPDGLVDLITRTFDGRVQIQQEQYQKAVFQKKRLLDFLRQVAPPGLESAMVERHRQPSPSAGLMG